MQFLGSCLTLTGNVFALCVVWGLKPFSAEMLLTMIQCLIDICKAEINNFPEGAIFANAYTNAQIMQSVC